MTEEIKEFQGCYNTSFGPHEYVYIGTDEGHKLFREEKQKLLNESLGRPSWNKNT